MGFFCHNWALHNENIINGSARNEPSKLLRSGFQYLDKLPKYLLDIGWKEFFLAQDMFARESSENDRNNHRLLSSLSGKACVLKFDDEDKEVSPLRFLL